MKKKLNTINAPGQPKRSTILATESANTRRGASQFLLLPVGLTGGTPWFWSLRFFFDMSIGEVPRLAWLDTILLSKGHGFSIMLPGHFADTHVKEESQAPEPRCATGQAHWEQQELACASSSVR